MLTLHGYWRSSAAYRVRIALNLKGLAYAQSTHDLRQNAQRDPSYLALAPHGLVPALETEAGRLIESLAILEWLEETAPQPALLPADPQGRAMVRAMAALVACDIHPLHNLRVLRDLRTRFGADQEAVNGWAAHWIAQGFAGLEALIAAHGGGFAFGDAPTLADCCLVPQVYSAERFGVDLEPFPHIRGAAERASSLPAVQAAHPDRQPDADRA
jgi:maleylpyruvate isomerase